MSPIAAPQLLAFPYHATVAGHEVYAEKPLTPAFETAISDGVRRAARSQLARDLNLRQPIILTDGGWRWHWLALQLSDAFALSRPLFETVVINRVEPDALMVRNGYGRQRSLASIVAHELTHGTIRARIGVFAEQRFPNALREGYCDFISGESTLSDVEARALIAQNGTSPGLAYWQGRKAIEAELKRNGGSEAALFNLNDQQR